MTRSWTSTAAVFLVLILGGAGAYWAMHVHDLASRAAAKAAAEAIPPTVEGIRLRLTQCRKSYDLPCQERFLVALVNQMPNDGTARAQLGIVMDQRSEYPQAIEQLHQAIEMGVGTYDLFAVYADALTHVGRDDEAIDWSYKSLSVYSKPVDVRGNLARLLVAQHRPYEALSLLEGYDMVARQAGQADYFGGQRIAIESSLPDQNAPPAANAALEAASLRLPAYEAHFWVPVVVGHARPSAFMIDTGATVVTLNAEALAASGATVHPEERAVQFVTADGRRTVTHPFKLDVLHVGPYVLHDVEAVSCVGCQSLLGQSALSHFDLQSSRHQGVEFLTITPRGHA
jgi:clan AA aspartic protease (TIGR02281 family)